MHAKNMEAQMMTLTPHPSDQAMAELGALARRLRDDILHHGHDTARTRLAQEARALSEGAIALMGKNEGLRVLVEPPDDNTKFESAIRLLAAIMDTSEA